MINRAPIMKRTVFYELAGEEGKMVQVSDNFPPSYIVIRFSRSLKPETLAWFLRRVMAKRKEGGAGLLVCRHPTGPSLTKGISVHLSASLDRILETAEEMEISKRDNSGLIREFLLPQLNDFLTDGMEPEDLFTTAERQSIVLHELGSLRAGPAEGNLPGYKIKLYPGQSLFQVFQRQGLVERCYPVHDKEELKKLEAQWYRNKSFFQTQPYETIRLYFGESVALYFIFLGFYTMALVPPVLLSLSEMLIPQTTTVFFCIFNVIWVTIFLEMWKRKSNELAFQWGTIHMTSLDEPRYGFVGEMGLDEVTGRYQPKYPRWKTNIKMYCVSLPLVFLCVVAAFIVMFISFWFENLIIENRREAEDDSIFAYIVTSIPGAVYGVVVWIMNIYYRNFATVLTEWENHRTQSQFERHRVTKLIIFEFINNFVSLFYIAFVIQDLDMVRTQLRNLLIIFQFLNALQETVLPILIRKYGKQISNCFKSRTNDYSKKVQDNFSAAVEEFLYDIAQLNENDERVVQAIKEAKMEIYEGTYDDYLEMFIQFGFVFLFSSVYPIAALWAVINNVIEIRSDAFKLCKVCQRPVPERVKNIGAWQRAFEALGALSIVTNCGLMCISPQLRGLSPDTPLVEWVLIFLAIEHGLLFVRYLINITIPDRPEWVRVALAKNSHQSKQALKYERAVKRDR